MGVAHIDVDDLINFLPDRKRSHKPASRFAVQRAATTGRVGRKCVADMPGAISPDGFEQRLDIDLQRWISGVDEVWVCVQVVSKQRHVCIGTIGVE